jgi:hypothetical protein
VTRLFAEVYLDEDVSVLVADLLRARGFRTVTTRDTGHLGQTDAEQLRYAARQGMAVLTHNREDFEALHREYMDQGWEHWGIIIAARRRPYGILEHLMWLLDQLTADELKNQLLYI